MKSGRTFLQILLGVLAPLGLAAPSAADVTAPAVEDHEFRPFDESANAMQDINAALLAAKPGGRRVALILGGNWCHDSRSLAKKVKTEPLKTLVADRYQIVWIDVGRRDRNLDAARRFGVEKLIGTPAIIVLSADGQVLNADSVHDWRNADSRTDEETYRYFESFAGVE